jgi:hypothetical protein
MSIYAYIHVCVYIYIYEFFLSVYSNLPYFFFFAVLGFELGAYTLRHSTSPFLAGFFEMGWLQSAILLISAS